MRSEARADARQASSSWCLPFQIGAPRWGGVSHGRRYACAPRRSSHAKVHGVAALKTDTPRFLPGRERPVTSAILEADADPTACSMDTDPDVFDRREADILIFAAHKHAREDFPVEAQTRRQAVSPGTFLRFVTRIRIRRLGNAADILDGRHIRPPDDLRTADCHTE